MAAEWIFVEALHAADSGAGLGADLTHSERDPGVHAGKATTIKIPSGILRPDAGRVEVDGLMPFEDRTEHVARIGVVFGQRTQLW